MGSANQAVTPGRTSLLEAVNICLAVIGEAPVNSLDEQQIGEAAQAERTLLEYHKEGQTRGWSWNRERSVSFSRDATSGEVLIPANVVQWAPSRLEWNNRFQARGGRVYDSSERSYVIEEGIASISADIVTLLAWDECPEVFNRWATIRAARVFSNRAVGNTSTYQLTQADEDQAWADLLRVDTEQSQPNAITGEAAWATYRPSMGLSRRGAGAGGGWSAGEGSGLVGGWTGGDVVLPQALGPDASPTFAGLTLSGSAGIAGQLCWFGAGGAVRPLPLGSGLSISGGALTATGGTGGYSSFSAPTGFSVGGSGTASISLNFAAGYSLPTTASQATWDTAYSERLQWDGGNVGLNAASARASLGLGTAATTASTDYATAAQGALAATAVQPAALDSYLTTAAAASAYQPLSSGLTAIAGLTTTTFGRSLLTQLDATAARGTLGLGTAATSATVDFASAAQGIKADAAAVAGAIGSSGLTMTAGVLGRETGTGAPQVYTLGSGLAIVGGALTATGGGGGGGGYPAFTAPTGFGVTGSGTASITLNFAAGYSLPTTASQATWDTAYSERLQWSGSSTGLNAATGRASLGLGTAATASRTEFATASHNQLASTIFDSTTVGRAVLTAADAATARGAIGAGTGDGTVTSVALSLPALFSVSGLPVTTSGTLTASLATQSANQLWAGPTTGAAAAPTFRALVAADLGTTLSPQFTSIGLGVAAATDLELTVNGAVVQARASLTAASNVYTIDITTANEFVTGAAIAANTTINLSNLASIPSGYVWRGVLTFSYTSGTITWFSANTGYTVKWDGGSQMTPTASETETVVITVVGGGSTIEVAALKGRT